MNTMLDIIKKEKAEIAEKIEFLKKEHENYDSHGFTGFYIVHSYEYLFKMAILTKQDLILDMVLANYYAQEDEQELANIHVGKEV